MNIDLNKIKDVKVAGIDRRDHPDYVDAFITSATYEGRALTETELSALPAAFVQERVFEELQP